MSQVETSVVPQGTVALRTSKEGRIWLTVLLSVCVYWGSRGFMNELSARALAIFTIAAIFWATGALPLFATAFVVIGLQILFLATEGGLAQHLTALLVFLGIDAEPTRTIDYTAFLNPFSKDIIILFMGGFLLSSALSKHGIDRVIASRVLRPMAKSPLKLLYGVLGITAFFSMWMSNTATTAMMLAIVSPVLKGCPREGHFHRGLILAVAFGANIGGIGTPIGTPPNAIAYGALNAAGYDITFLHWMLVAVPLQVLLLGITGIILYRAFPPAPGLEIVGIEPEGALRPRGWLTLGILVATLLLWLTSGWHGIKPGAVALLAAAALTSFSVLDRRDVDSIDWDLLILMWGGLSLSVGMRETGLAELISGLDLRGLPGGGFLLALIAVSVTLVLSTIMSNTATASLLVPMALAFSVSHREEYAMLVALACNFAMAMPVSTPPNAMAFSTGFVPLKTMLRVGSTTSLICVGALLIGYQIMLPLLF